MLDLLWAESWLLWVWGHVGTSNRCLSLSYRGSLGHGLGKLCSVFAEGWMTGLSATRRKESPSQLRWITTFASQGLDLPSVSCAISPSLHSLPVSLCNPLVLILSRLMRQSVSWLICPWRCKNVYKKQGYGVGGLPLRSWCARLELHWNQLNTVVTAYVII